MAGLHPYVWELYRETPDGAAMLDYFSKLPTEYRTSSLYSEILNGTNDLQEVLESGSPVSPPSPDLLGFLELIKAFAEARPAATPEQTRELLEALISERGPSFSEGDEEFRLDEYLALDYLHIISLAVSD